MYNMTCQIAAGPGADGAVGPPALSYLSHMTTPISPAHPRIIRDYGICHGRPVVRGLRYPVWSVLDYLKTAGYNVNATRNYLSGILSELLPPFTRTQVPWAVSPG